MISGRGSMAVPYCTRRDYAFDLLKPAEDLLQLGVFRLGLLVNADIGVGIFP